MLLDELINCLKNKYLPFDELDNLNGFLTVLDTELCLNHFAYSTHSTNWGQEGEYKICFEVNSMDVELLYQFTRHYFNLKTPNCIILNKSLKWLFPHKEIHFIRKIRQDINKSYGWSSIKLYPDIYNDFNKAKQQCHLLIAPYIKEESQINKLDSYSNLKLYSDIYNDLNKAEQY